jgi:hypothetical protein
MIWITKLKPNVLDSFNERLPEPIGVSQWGNEVFSDKPNDYWYKVRTTENFNSTNDPARVHVIFSDRVGNEKYILKSYAQEYFITPIWVSEKEYHLKLLSTRLSLNA